MNRHGSTDGDTSTPYDYLLMRVSILQGPGRLRSV
jgi:hypothetical protein